jgi:hypothetical protein
MTFNTGTNKFDVSVPSAYGDSNVRTVLSTSAGTGGISWNSGTNKFDVSVSTVTPSWTTVTNKPFTILDTTSYSPTTTQSECEIIMYPRAAGANTLLSGRVWVEKPLKFTAATTSGGAITTYLPPYISLDINTNTLEIDTNGKLNVKGGSSSQWTTTGSNIYYNTGNVGIGSSTNSSDDGNVNIAIPDSTFYVRGPRTAGSTSNITFRGGLEGHSNGKVRIWMISDAAHSSYIESDHPGNGFTNLTFGTSGGNTLPTERMRIASNGAVGIQTSGYAIPNNHMAAGSLTIGNFNANYGGGGNWTTNTAGLMMECQDNTEIVIHDAANALHSFMYYSGNTFTIGRNIGYNTANVNIAGKLTLNRNTFAEFYGTSSTGYGSYIYHGNGVASLQSNYTYFGDLVVKFNGSTWTTSWIGASSSAKIKKDIQDLDDNECLNKLLALRPVKYRYIDITKNFDPIKSVYGFIAEEVKEVLPEAVNDKEKELIPNIYIMGSVENDILTIEKELEIDVEYTCYSETETIKIKVIEDLGNNNYKIDKTYEIKTDLFVYGKVDDNFHILKKEYFHALTISSVQELHKIIVQQRNKINDLESRLVALEAIVMKI